MNALSMYSGGCDGISLAALWVGISTLAYCDNDAACRALLQSRHPDAPIFTNDEDVTTDALRNHGIDPRTIDIIFGGPPCQIASVAGQRRGAGDERNRWPEFLRIIRDIGPRWVLAENVPGLLSVQGKTGAKGELFGDILSTLAEMGYRVGWCCYGAADVGAPHKRERLFLVGYAQHNGLAAAQIGSRADAGDDGGTTGAVCAGEPARSDQRHVADADGVRSDAWRPQPARFERTAQPDGSGAIVADTESAGLPQRGCIAGGSPEHAARPERFGAALEHAHSQRCEEHLAAPVRDGQGLTGGRPAEGGRARAAQPGLGGDLAGVSGWLDSIAARLEAQRWPARRGQEQFGWEPPRVATGVPDRAARIRMIGNSCPPQQYAVMLAAIAEADRLLGGDA